MTILDDDQLRMLKTVRERYQDVQPTLDRLQLEYQLAVYKAKRPVQDAVDEAMESGIPLSKIAMDAVGFSYPQKLRRWLEPDPELAVKLAGGDTVLHAAETFEDEVDTIESVTRSPQDGSFSVVYKGDTYTVSAIGPDTEPWSTREEGIPQGVYNLIVSKYPGFVVLNEEDLD